MNPQGKWLEELEDVAGVAVQYFTDLFFESQRALVPELMNVLKLYHKR